MTLAKWTAAAGLAVILSGCATVNLSSSTPLAHLPATGTIDERFLSYNIEMVEVTGGRFWAPYGGPTGELYRQRPPEDLTDPRLRALTRHLGPAWVRVSGTWANTTYLPEAGETVSSPPAGFNQVLQRDQWRGLVAFASAVDARIMVSMAVSAGTRGPDGAWRSDQADRMLTATRAFGGRIDAAEFINEPNAAIYGGLPQGYRAADYARDFQLFRDWARRAAPSMLLVGPSSVGEGALGAGGEIPVAVRNGGVLLTDTILSPNPHSLDVFSYHFYGSVSQRCDGRTRQPSARRADALSPTWLDLTLRDHSHYAALRDRFESGDPIWVTETAQAACGGSPWAAHYVDAFRFVNQLGLLAQRGVQVVFHNTLTASDYSLIDEQTRTPRPNYWAALLWRRTMGTTVLAAPPSPSPQLRIFAHCLPARRGGVGLTLVNIGDTVQRFTFGSTGRVWHLNSSTLDSRAVTVNGQNPSLNADGSLSGLNCAPINSAIDIPATAIAFVVVPDAGNTACR